MSEAAKRNCAVCFADNSGDYAVDEDEETPLCDYHQQAFAAADLRTVIEALETVDWRHVDGMGALEAAQLQQRLRDARRETLPALDTRPNNGGEPA